VALVSFLDSREGRKEAVASGDEGRKTGDIDLT